MIRVKEIASGVAVLAGIVYAWNRAWKTDFASIGKSQVSPSGEIRRPNVMHVQGREIEGGRYAKTVSESDFAEGEVLMTLEFLKCSDKTYQTLQLGQLTHAIEIFSSYFNHNCNPSVKIVVLTEKVDELLLNGVILADVVALRDIAAGDEINFAYFTTEWDMAEKFQCKCGFENCCGLVGGAKSMERNLLRPYEDQLLDHIKHSLDSGE